MSEHQFAGCPIWEHHPDAMVLLTRRQRPGLNGINLIVSDLNPRAESMFGYVRAIVMGESVERFAPSSHLVPDSGKSAGVFQARRSDGSAFAATATVTPLGPPNHHYMVVIRDMTDLVAWSDGLPIAARARLDDLHAREQAVEAGKETLAQHLFAAGLAIQQLDNPRDSQNNGRMEQAIAALDEVMIALMNSA